MEAKEATDKIKELLEQLKSLAEYGFHFYIAGIGVLLFLFGIFANLVDVFDIFMSKNESLVITVFGLVFVVLGVLIWHQKSRFTMQTYLAELEWCKFRLKILSEEATKKEPPKFD